MKEVFVKPNNPGVYSSTRQQYIEGEVHNAERNRLIVEKAVEYPKPCVIVCYSNKHIYILKNMLKCSGMSSIAINSGASKEIMDATNNSNQNVIYVVNNLKVDLLEREDIRTIIIATQIDMSRFIQRNAKESLYIIRVGY